MIEEAKSPNKEDATFGEPEYDELGTDIELCELCKNDDPIDEMVDFCLLPLHKKSDIVRR